MANVCFKGKEIITYGELPRLGSTVPELWVTSVDLEEVCVTRNDSEFTILNIVPSLDTGVCAASAREFDERTVSMLDVQVNTVSRDLPFALHRFLRHENLRHTRLFSSVRDTSFGDTLGVTIVSGPLKGLFARAVFLLDSGSRLLYCELVPDVSQEPDYTSVFSEVEKHRNQGAPR
ncbi:MAG: thiol peroxidase [Spirochaetales bacterium]|nr:thiol peroxidase [Spirochaetales bacterium]